MFAAPELQMSDADGKLFATAAANVARHYNLRTTQKMVDWAAAVCAVGTIYAPKLRAYNLRRRAEREAAANPPMGSAGNGAMASAMQPMPFTPPLFMVEPEDDA